MEETLAVMAEILVVMDTAVEISADMDMAVEILAVMDMAVLEEVMAEVDMKADLVVVMEADLAEDMVADMAELLEAMVSIHSPNINRLQMKEITVADSDMAEDSVVIIYQVAMEAAREDMEAGKH